MATDSHFHVSSLLKDIIGKDLVTNEYVALFELVKNSIDAGATAVDIILDLERDRIFVVDDGKGMSIEDIRKKWLWVAYSAKKDGTEDTYLDRVKPNSRYAGSKGIGRFSADTLGRRLVMYTRARDANEIAVVKVNWRKFERRPRNEFDSILVPINHATSFPKVPGVSGPHKHGTVLVISGLRHNWDEMAIRALRKNLQKLVDPFGASQAVPVGLWIIGDEIDEDVRKDASGPIRNDLAEVLSGKTTRIDVIVENGMATSTLNDRGTEVFTIRENAGLGELVSARIEAQLLYLNRAAKQTFAMRAGVRAHEYGNVFVFLNGFRVYPIGEPDDDTFGILKRKQQGSSRYLGTRDLLGRIDVEVEPGVLREASSRDAGLIQGEAAGELEDFVVRKLVRRLERYVTTVSWPDKTDADREDASMLRSDPARARIISVVRAIVGPSDVQLVSFNEDVIGVLDERFQGFVKAMDDLVGIAEATGDQRLLNSVEAARARQKELLAIEREARLEVDAAEREAAEARRDTKAALVERDVAVARADSAERQLLVIDRTGSRSVESLLAFHHQARIHASEATSLGRRALARIEKAGAGLSCGQSTIDHANLLEDASRFVAEMMLQISRIDALTGLAIQAKFDLDSGYVVGDVVGYLEDYLANIVAVSGVGVKVFFDSAGRTYRARYDPVGLAIVVDNLVSNAKKARASSVWLSVRPIEPRSQVLVVEVSDDGRGLCAADPERIFEKGYSTTRSGTGLGLYHARRAMEDMGGQISLAPDAEADEARFLIQLPTRMKAVEGDLR